MSHKRFGGRTLARSQALQLLFQAEATDRTVADVLMGSYALSQDDPLDEFGEQLAVGADAMRHELDAVIAQASKNWSVSRMPSVDRNLLRLAVYEMLQVEEVALAVTIDESVELAKAYGTDESSRFVNGLLGRIATQIESGQNVFALGLAHEEELERARAKKAAQEASERQAAEEEQAQLSADDDAQGSSEADGDAWQTRDAEASLADANEGGANAFEEDAAAVGEDV